MKRPNANIFRKKHCIHNINETLKQEKEAIQKQRKLVRETNKEIRRYFKIRGKIVVNTRDIPNIKEFISYYEERGFMVEHHFSDGVLDLSWAISYGGGLPFDQYVIS
jgi:hypothetical protein